MSGGVQFAVMAMLVAFPAANATTSEPTFGFEHESALSAQNVASDRSSQMIGVKWQRVNSGPGYVEFDIRAVRIVDILPSLAQGPAKAAVEAVLYQIPDAILGAGQVNGSKFEILLDRDFKASVMVGCPKDLGERAKSPECMQADIPVRDIQWRQRIDDVTVYQGGRVSLDKSGRIVRIAGVLVDVTSVPVFRISGDVAERLAVEFIRSAHMQSESSNKDTWCRSWQVSRDRRRQSARSLLGGRGRDYRPSRLSRVGSQDPD